MAKNFEIENWDVWQAVVAQAVVAVTNDTTITSANALRWINAIGNGAKDAEQRDGAEYFMTWDEETESLFVFSAVSSGMVYDVRHSCQCKASVCGLPCRHRAARRLIQSYYQRLSELEPPKTLSAGASFPTIAKMNNAPYLKPTSTKPVEKFGSFRI